MIFISLLLFVLTCALRGDPLDITTLRRRDRLEDLICIVGTNALGYPLVGPNGTILEPEYGAARVGSCHVALGRPCAWKGDAWAALPGVGRLRLPPFARPEELPLRSSAAAPSSVVAMPRAAFRVRLRAARGGGGGWSGGESVAAAAARLLLVSAAVLSPATELLAVEVARQGGQDTADALLRCGGAGPGRGRRARRLGSGLGPAPCAAQARPGDRLPLAWTEAEAELTLAVSTEGGELRLWRDGAAGGGRGGEPLLAQPLPLDFEVQYVAAVTTGRDALWTLLLDRPALVLSRRGGNESAAVLRSPPLGFASPGPARVACVSFFAFARPGAGARLALRVTRGAASRAVLQLHDNRSEEEAGRWRFHRLRVDLGAGGEGGEEAFLELHASADEEGAVALHSIMGCNPWGPTESIRMLLPDNVEAESEYLCEAALQPQKTPGRTCGVCQNGGVCMEDSGECACRPGFVGRHCEEGCGEGHWGADCASHCSNQGCRYLQLCGARALGCSCAPGLRGPDCDTPCEAGSYGSECAVRCGHCLRGAPCNRFDGRCPRGCEPGFRAPRCQRRYTYLSKPPVIRNITYDSATVSFSMDPESLAGEGHPRFYQIIYWADGRRAPLREAPRLLPPGAGAGAGEDAGDGAGEGEGGAVVWQRLEALQPGRQHRVVVVLIDRDGATAANVAALRSARFSTRCRVPMEPIYYLNVLNVMRNSFVFSWRFKTNSSVACDADAFEVLVGDADSQFSLASTERQLLEVPDLSPGERYMVRVRALTRSGPAPPSHHLAVTTVPAAPSPVRGLDFEQVSPTELLIKWNPPLVTGRRIAEYQVIYECIRLLACPEGSRCPGGRRGRAAGDGVGVGVGVGVGEGGEELARSANSSVALRRLHPHAQYQVAVVAVQADGQRSDPARITALTLHSVPAVAPRAAARAVTRHNASALSVTWLAAGECAALRGYPEGYRYRVVRVGAGASVPLAWRSVARPPVLVSGMRAFATYEVHVHQLVTGGLYSSGHKLVIPVETAVVSPQIRNLTAEETNSTFVKLSWLSPVDFNPQYIRHYLVSYECLQHLACFERRPCGSLVSLITNDTEIVLTGMTPYAEYIINIAAFTGTIGMTKTFTLFTGAAASEAPPAPVLLAKTPSSPPSSPLSVPTSSLPSSSPSSPTSPSSPWRAWARGATWLEVRWRPPGDCARVRGPLAGYSLRVLRAGRVVQEAVVDVAASADRATAANVTDLTPATDYEVRVAAVTAAADGRKLFSDVALVMRLTTLPLDSRAESDTGPDSVMDAYIYGAAVKGVLATSTQKSTVSATSSAVASPPAGVDA